MSSANVKLGNSVKSLVDFIRESTVNNITTAANKGDLNISERDLSTMIGLLESSFSYGFSRGYIEVSSALNEILKASNTNE